MNIINIEPERVLLVESDLLLLGFLLSSPLLFALEGFNIGHSHCSRVIDHIRDLEAIIKKMKCFFLMLKLQWSSVSVGSGEGRTYQGHVKFVPNGTAFSGCTCRESKKRQKGLYFCITLKYRDDELVYTTLY